MLHHVWKEKTQHYDQMNILNAHTLDESRASLFWAQNMKMLK